MTTLVWPDTVGMRPAKVEWSPSVVPEMVSVSAFNQHTQAQVLGAGYWVVQIEVGPRRRQEVPAWEAWIAQMSNTANRIRMWDWRWETPQGTGGGLPVVLGAGQSGVSLATSGWPVGVTGVLLPGDYVGIAGDQLRRVVAQVDSNVAGQATLTLDQPLRSSPGNGSLLTLTKPTGLFICTTEKAARGFRQDGARHFGPTLAFREVFA